MFTEFNIETAFECYQYLEMIVPRELEDPPTIKEYCARLAWKWTKKPFQDEGGVLESKFLKKLKNGQGN